MKVRFAVSLDAGRVEPGHLASLVTGAEERGFDTLLPELRTWWVGSAVTVGRGGAATEVTLPVLPRQDPLEIWLGGHGPQAVRRAGRLADGWLGSGAALGPRQAGELCRRVKEEAAAAGREIDPEHFGLSIQYARAPDDLSAPDTRPIASAADQSSAPAPPVGAGALRDLVGELVQEGMSKFVVRRAAPVASWPDELDWLADAVLDLQT